MRKKKSTNFNEECKIALHFVNQLTEDMRRTTAPPPSLDTASTALKKQVPKSATVRYIEIEHTGEFVTEITCPECNAVMPEYDDGKPLDAKYCYNCGQALYFVIRIS